jgi:predicted RNase H-like HicB family nuclease
LKEWCLNRRQEISRYTIILEPNYPEEGYTVRAPALPGCITYGRTREEALLRAKEAIEGLKRQANRFQRRVLL